MLALLDTLVAMATYFKYIFGLVLARQDDVTLNLWRYDASPCVSAEPDPGVAVAGVFPLHKKDITGVTSLSTTILLHPDYLFLPLQFNSIR
jgi:hypothetical protein